MKILGISAFYHDSAAAIVNNGEIIAAAQEERFTRKKHDAVFPQNAVKFCLTYAGYSLSELDAVVFYDKPLLKFERLLETYYRFSPRGLASFNRAIPVWLKEKLFIKRLLNEELKKIGEFNKKKIKILFAEHHLSHAASAFHPSPFDEAAILTIDGVGEWATTSIGYGNKSGIKIIKELHFPHSLGLLYSSFTYYLGFTVNSGEYKLMGLAPYGEPDSSRVNRFLGVIKEKMVDIKEDGSIWLNQDYFNYATGLKMVNERRWQNLLGLSRRRAEDNIDQTHCDLALAIQKLTEEVVLKMSAEAKRLTGSDNLCLAGGVALNCVANGRLLRSGLFKRLFIQPAAGDAGGALGAALAANYIYFQTDRQPAPEDGMSGTYLGPEFSDLEIELISRKYKAVYHHFDDFDHLAEEVAGFLAEGNVVGWFQGRMEFGPRALGNRSILGDPSNRLMQKKLNLKIKFREGFRPFAPSVMAEDASTYFDMDVESPYMLLVADVRNAFRKNVPADYYQLPMMERLYVNRSEFQAITHVDFSARIQTVNKRTNPRQWALLNKFKSRTGHGILVNTSFNVRGEPIVCSPDEAFRCFMRTDMDYLVISNYVFRKTEQPNWLEREAWYEEFATD